MIARLLISPSLDKIKEEITTQLASHIGSGNVDHPDILYFERSEKLGIAEAKKIKGHFSLKPYSAQGRAAVLEDASVMTTEAQNALLKTLEELPTASVLILGTNSEANLLPTILSRCQIIRIQSSESRVQNYKEEIAKLLTLTTAEKFEVIEKLRNKEEFLAALAVYFRQLLYAPGHGLTKLEVTEFLKELLQAEERAKQNVNIRAILEYLMLVMPDGK